MFSPAETVPAKCNHAKKIKGKQKHLLYQVGLFIYKLR